jgi:two-component system OmpR family sensor kinase
VSLRARLTVVAVGLVALGLLVADVATYRQLSSFLIRRVDEQLAAAREPAFHAAADEGGGFQPGPDVSLPSGSYVQVLDASGSVVRARVLGYTPQGVQPVALPDGLAQSEPVTFSASNPEGIDFRVQATSLGPSGGALVVAIPLTDVEFTLRRLLLLEALVGLIVLSVVALVASRLVRVGLRPLKDIERTAGAIAAGDLSRRVEPTDERTEIGRLGIALNAMLAQIEVAFEERRASESRLRRFIADASHELRTPLTSIRGYAELFRRGASSRPEDLAKSMARIEAEAGRMGILVDDLLLLARLDQGRPLRREHLDLVRVVGESVDAARAIEPDRPIQLEAPAAIALLGDEGRLRQVVDNLLDNVRVHTPAATPAHVRITAEADIAVVEVADQGEGMPADVADRIFERFFRGDPARSRDTGGAGLGLSIVAAILEAHGGTVEVGERPGGGSLFTVRLPLGETAPGSEATGDEASAQPEAQPEAIPPRGDVTADHPPEETTSPVRR